MPAFLVAIGTKRDKFSNCKAHLSGNDPGGVRPSTAAQLRANPLHINATNPHPAHAIGESAAAFENREAELFAYIRQHITNVGLLSDLDRLNTVYINKDYSQGCPVFPVPAPTPAVAGAPGAIPAGTPLYPADHPRAGTIVDQIDIAKYQAFGNSIARYAWGLVYAYGTKMLTPIYLESQNYAWATVKMADVGISERTMTDLAALLNTLSNERGPGNEKTDEEKRTRFLTIITSPFELAQEAMRNLTFASTPCRDIATGLPSWRATVSYFDEIWFSHYIRGDPRYTAPRMQPRYSFSNRVDGMMSLSPPQYHPHE